MQKNNILVIPKKTIFNNTITFSDDEIFGIESRQIDNSKNFTDYRDCHTIKFLNCIFKERIVINTTKKTFEFTGCEIDYCQQPPTNEKIKFEQCNFHRVDKPINLNDGTIKNLILIKSTISNKFYINSDSQDSKIFTKITNLKLSNVIFEKKFKLYNCEIENTTIEKIDFKDDADFEKTKFLNENNISFSGIQFHKLALFSNTYFKSKIIFQKTTFYDEGSFVGATFNKGILLKNITIKRTLNFANTNGFDDESIRKEMTRETFRIIKHNFKKLNNKIDYNLFNSYELEAKYNQLKEDMQKLYSSTEKNDKQKYLKLWPERIIYTIHKKSSFFGTSWLSSLKYILYVSLFTTILFYYYNEKYNPNFLENLNLNSFIQSLNLFGSYLFKFMSIIYSDEKIKDFFKDWPFMFIIHKGALGYLYYQFITAVRKDTKN